MKRWMLFGLLLVGMTAQAQTARKFTLNLTDDGKAQMVCFLPETPSGKAIGQSHCGCAWWRLLYAFEYP